MSDPSLDYPEAIRTESARLLAAARDRLDALVPSCPGWRMGDLVFHLGEVQDFWAHVASSGPVEQPSRDDHPEPARPADAALLAWAQGRTAALLDAIADLDLDAPLWNWSRGPQVGAFVPRRMAQEAAVHRWDAQHAAALHGAPDEEARDGRAGVDPIAAGLALDGLDEFLTLFVEAADGEPESRDARLGLDPDGEHPGWTITLAHPLPETTAGVDADADLVLSGPAGELLLELWGRPAELRRSGDEAAGAAVLDRLRAYDATE